MHKFSLELSLILGLCVFAPGCGAVDPDAVSEMDPVGEVEEALGEPGCGTVACPVAGKCASVTLNPNGAAASTSPGTTYGSATCPGQYVVQSVNPPTFGKILLSPNFGEVIAQANCASARLDSALYAKENGVTKLIGTSHHAGVWSNNFCVLTSPTAAPMVTGRPSITEVRAVSRAYFAGPVPTPKKVRPGLVHFQ
jgi:hypothetical protein